MMTIDAPFHKLPGIGAATEAKLHEAGIHTWEGLAVVLDALARVRDVDAKRLREIRDRAQDQAGESVSDGTVNGERSTQFVVRVVTHPDGSVARSTIVDVRTGLEKAFPRINGDDIAGFIGERLREMASGSPSAARGKQATPPPPVEEDDTIRFSGSSVANDLVILDAGKAIGGSTTSIRRQWDTSGIEAGESGAFAFRASLAARPYGTDEADWRPIGMVAGRARPGEEVKLEFPAGDLAPGINRLDLTIELTDLVTADAGAGPRRIGGDTRTG